MIKKCIRVVLICFILLFIITAFVEIPKYINGQYIETEATITYVNNFKGYSNGREYDRASGTIEYIYNENKYQPEEYIDFKKDAEIGDTIKIIIDKETGKYQSQNLYSLSLGIAIWLGILLAILKLTYREPKTIERRLKDNHHA